MSARKPQFAMDIMRTDLITARPDMTCEELQELLVINRIGGVPVVDEDEALVGVISMWDILSSGMNLAYTPDYFEAMRLDGLLEPKGFHLEMLSAGNVEDYMTRGVITAYPHSRIEELAEMMYTNHIHRVIIVKPQDNTVAGIVTTFDLLKVLMGNSLSGKTAKVTAAGASI